MRLKGSEYVTPKYTTLAQGLFCAEGSWESTDAGRILCPPLICLKVEHQFSFAKMSIPLYLLPVLHPQEEKITLVTGDWELTPEWVCQTVLTKIRHYRPLVPHIFHSNFPMIYYPLCYPKVGLYTPKSEFKLGGRVLEAKKRSVLLPGKGESQQDSVLKTVNPSWGWSLEVL